MLPRSLASAWRSSVVTLQAPKGPGLFTSAWSNSGHDKTDSPEQKKGVVTDPDLAPPKPESGKHDTPSSQKTNELEKGAGAPSGDKPLKSGETPKPNKRSFHTSAAGWADNKRAAATDSPAGKATGRTQGQA